MRTPIISALSLVVAAVLFAAWFVVRAPGPHSIRQFDPNRTADLETDMWKAYYAKQKLRLFGLLVEMLHEQHHYSWWTATVDGFYLARAAAAFGDATGNYEVVLPDLARAFGVTRDWVGGGFDPQAVAKAELSWWVARRIPGQDSPEHVGSLMADSYALMYEVPHSEMLTAAVLRAQAGKLRDDQAANPDWTTVNTLLRESYRSLHAALATH